MVPVKYHFNLKAQIFLYCRILIFSMITELMAKREEQQNLSYDDNLILIFLNFILIERLALNKPFVYTTVLDLIYPVLQKSVPLSFKTQPDVKLFVFQQSNNEKIVHSSRFRFLVIKCCQAI